VSGAGPPPPAPHLAGVGAVVDIDVAPTVRSVSAIDLELKLRHSQGHGTVDLRVVAGVEGPGRGG
jgi:hypothetical protein